MILLMTSVKNGRTTVGQLVSVSISGRQVARFLSQLLQEHSKSAQIVCDNGTEFASKAMFSWSKESRVSWHLTSQGNLHRTRLLKASIASSEPNASISTGSVDWKRHVMKLICGVSIATTSDRIALEITPRLWSSRSKLLRVNFSSRK